MPFYEAPNSDSARVSFLQRAIATGKQDATAGANYVFADSLTEVTTFLPDFETKVNALAETLSGRVKEVRERAAAIDRVKLIARDFWEVLKRRVRRDNQPAEVLTYYGLPLSGAVPNLSSQDEWLTLINKVVEGDDKAVAAGYPAMLNPSASELKDALAIATSEANDVAMADRTYDQAQEAVAALRPQADDLISDVVDQLRFQLRKKDAPSQRRIMRTYGAKFRYLKGEPADADDAEPVGEE